MKGRGLMSDVSEFLEEFIHESEDALRQAEAALLKVEKGEEFKPHYQAIFRAFHSIKGGARLFNLNNTEHLVHKLETDFTLHEKGNFTPADVTYFLDGVDVILQLVLNDNAKVDVSRFMKPRTQDSSAAPNSAPPEASATPKQETNTASSSQEVQSGAPHLSVVPNTGGDLAASKASISAQAPGVPQQQQHQAHHSSKSGHGSAPVLTNESVSPHLNVNTSFGRVIVVDDEEDIVETIKEHLSDFQLEVHGFTNPWQVLKSFDQIQPDVIISDFKMPGVDGWALAQQLHEKNPDLPIIIVSGHLGSEVEKKMSGTYLMIDKPFKLSRLTTLVYNAITEYKMTLFVKMAWKLIWQHIGPLEDYLQEKGMNHVRDNLVKDMEELSRLRRTVLNKKVANM